MLSVLARRVRPRVDARRAQRVISPGSSRGVFVIAKGKHMAAKKKAAKKAKPAKKAKRRAKR